MSEGLFRTLGKTYKEYSCSRKSYEGLTQGTIYEELLIFHLVFIDRKSGMKTL